MVLQKGGWYEKNREDHFFVFQTKAISEKTVITLGEAIVMVLLQRNRAMFHLEGATFGLFLGGPVRLLRSFRTKDITADNHPKYAHQKKTKYIFNLATKYFETCRKTNVVVRKN